MCTTVTETFTPSCAPLLRPSQLHVHNCAITETETFTPSCAPLLRPSQLHVHPAKTFTPSCAQLLKPSHLNVHQWWNLYTAICTTDETFTPPRAPLLKPSQLNVQPCWNVHTSCAPPLKPSHLHMHHHWNLHTSICTATTETFMLSHLHVHHYRNLHTFTPWRSPLLKTSYVHTFTAFATDWNLHTFMCTVTETSASMSATVTERSTLSRAKRP